MSIFLFVLNVFPVKSLTLTGNLYVSTSGVDLPMCGSQAAPCRNLQYTVSKAASGDSIFIAEGTYTFTTDACGNNSNAVVCVLNKNLTLIGGFNNAWSGPAPEAYPTIIDGENVHRGVVVQGNPTAQPYATFDGVTIRNARGAPLGSHGNTSHGGGILFNFATGAVRNAKLINNKSVGPDTSSGAGGIGTGAGLAVMWSPNASQRPAQPMTLSNVTFDGNQALGGSGPVRGGEAHGGAIFTFYARVQGGSLTFINNIALASRSGGAGADNASAQRADGLGGAVSISTGSEMTIDGASFRNNIAQGGAASTWGGHGFGGAVFGELGTLNLVNCDIRSNKAVGATGNTGGIGGGGGVHYSNVVGKIERTRVIDNSAIGGNGQTAGPAGGGGLYLTRFDSTANTINIVNSIIADNLAQQGTGASSGGGGGGVWVQGESVVMTHVTLARNRVIKGMIGQALITINDGTQRASTAALNFSIIEGHTGEGVAAYYLFPGTTLVLQKGLHAANGTLTSGGGTANGISSMQTAQSANFASPGAPNFNYQLSSGSPAVDAASGSTTNIDIDSTSRPIGKERDIGADEFFDSANLRPQVRLPIVTR